MKEKNVVVFVLRINKKIFVVQSGSPPLLLLRNPMHSPRIFFPCLLKAVPQSVAYLVSFSVWKLSLHRKRN